MENKSLTSCRGFRVAAVRAGIKRSGKYDLGIVVADEMCTAAATFTTNKVVAPCVVSNRLKIRGGKAQAIFVNAGNANTCTGPRGEKDVERICSQVAKHFKISPNAVLVCSTGIIGEYLPMEKVRAGIDQAAGSVADTAENGADLAKAIMTTDTCEKTAYREIAIDSQTVKLAGIAKGAGMIAPNMATMLAFFTTDADISSNMLKRAFKHAVAWSFNHVTIDNHMSTSDSAIILASGKAGNKRITKVDDNYQIFAQALIEVCDDLARQMAADGEGATCAVTVRVKSAASVRDARRAVRAMVDSPLVRTAFNGADPNWGRVVSAVGYSGAKFDVNSMLCTIAGTAVFRKGRPCNFDAAKLSEKMKAKYWEVVVELAQGDFEDYCYTCDISKEYVAINADYHT